MRSKGYLRGYIELTRRLSKGLLEAYIGNYIRPA
jgi:hypothetical protein